MRLGYAVPVDNSGMGPGTPFSPHRPNTRFPPAPIFGIFSVWLPCSPPPPPPRTATPPARRPAPTSRACATTCNAWSPVAGTPATHGARGSCDWTGRWEGAFRGDVSPKSVAPWPSGKQRCCGSWWRRCCNRVRGWHGSTPSERWLPPPGRHWEHASSSSVRLMPPAVHGRPINCCGAGCLPSWLSMAPRPFRAHMAYAWHSWRVNAMPRAWCSRITKAGAKSAPVDWPARYACGLRPCRCPLPVCRHPCGCPHVCPRTDDHRAPHRTRASTRSRSTPRSPEPMRRGALWSPWRKGGTVRVAVRPSR